MGSSTLLKNRIKRYVNRLGEFVINAEDVKDGEIKVGCKGAVTSIRSGKSLAFDTCSITQGPFYGRIKIAQADQNEEYVYEPEFYDIIKAMR